MKALLTQNEFVQNFINVRIKEATHPSFYTTKEGKKSLKEYALAMYQLYIKSPKKIILKQKKTLLTQNEFVQNFINIRVKEATQPSFYTTKEGKKSLKEYALAMYQLHVQSFRK